MVEALAIMRHGGLALDPDAWTATWNGDAVMLTVSEFTILRTLASMPSRIFSRDMIIDRLHGPGFAVTDRTIDSHWPVMRLPHSAVWHFAVRGRTAGPQRDLPARL